MPGRRAAPWSSAGRIGKARSGLVYLTATVTAMTAPALPFRDATVVGVAAEADGVGIEGKFDTIVIDGDPGDLHRIDALTRIAIPALRPGGRVIVPLDPVGTEESPGSPVEPPTFAGLHWHGLAVLNARPCGVLSLDHSDAPPIAPMLVTANMTLRLASGAAGGGGVYIPVDRVLNVSAQHRADRRRGEQALLGHLSAMADELDRTRRRLQQPPTLRAVVLGSKWARPLLPLLRPIWRLARKARREVGRLRRRARIGRS